MQRWSLWGEGWSGRVGFLWPLSMIHRLSIFPFGGTVTLKSCASCKGANTIQKTAISPAMVLELRKRGTEGHLFRVMLAVLRLHHQTNAAPNTPPVPKLRTVCPRGAVYSVRQCHPRAWRLNQTESHTRLEHRLLDRCILR